MPSSGQGRQRKVISQSTHDLSGNVASQSLAKKTFTELFLVSPEKTVCNPATLRTQRLQITIISRYPFSIKISLNLLTQRSGVNLSTFPFSKNPKTLLRLSGSLHHQKYRHKNWQMQQAKQL